MPLHDPRKSLSSALGELLYADSPQGCDAIYPFELSIRDQGCTHRTTRQNDARRAGERAQNGTSGAATGPLLRRYGALAAWPHLWEVMVCVLLAARDGGLVGDRREPGTYVGRESGDDVVAFGWRHRAEELPQRG